MGFCATTNEAVKTLRGLHLYHFAFSNCSQRVRLALEEKGLVWTSHHLNLAANEHVTPEYRSINPNGVVPTLVHDGQVIIESNDIIAYIDEQFPEPPFCPREPVELARMREHLAAASAIQSAIKTLSHHLLFRPFRKIGAAEISLYERQNATPELLSFLRDYAADGDAWQARVARARTEMDTALDRLEAALGERPWLSGASFGLADVSWVVNAHRLAQAGYATEAQPRLRAWYEKVAERPAFDRAIASYAP